MTDQTLTDADLLAWAVIGEYRHRQRRGGLKILLLPFPPCPACGEQVYDAETSTVERGIDRVSTINMAPCGHVYTVTDDEIERVHRHAADLVRRMEAADNSLDPNVRGWTTADVIREAQACIAPPGPVGCSAAFLYGHLHAPHDWQPQPGMTPVHCPGGGNQPVRATGNTAGDALRERLVESLDNYPAACWTSRNLAGRVMGVVGGELDQWEKTARDAGAQLARVREAVASFDGRGVIAPGHVNLDIPTAGEVLDKIREALDGPTDNGTAGFVPATPKHFADMPHTDADPLVIEPYRNDQNQPRWAFRCWGTEACDGWLSLELTSERWAEVVRDRHIAEAHPEMAATEATQEQP